MVEWAIGSSLGLLVGMLFIYGLIRAIDHGGLVGLLRLWWAATRTGVATVLYGAARSAPGARSGGVSHRLTRHEETLLEIEQLETWLDAHPAADQQREGEERALRDSRSEERELADAKRKQQVLDSMETVERVIREKRAAARKSAKSRPAGFRYRDGCDPEEVRRGQEHMAYPNQPLLYPGERVVPSERLKRPDPALGTAGRLSMLAPPHLIHTTTDDRGRLLLVVSAAYPGPLDPCPDCTWKVDSIDDPDKKMQLGKTLTRTKICEHHQES